MKEEKCNVNYAIFASMSAVEGTLAFSVLIFFMCFNFT